MAAADADIIGPILIVFNILLTLLKFIISGLLAIIEAHRKDNMKMFM